MCLLYLRLKKKKESLYSVCCTIPISNVNEKVDHLRCSVF